MHRQICTDGRSQRRRQRCHYSCKRYRRTANPAPSQCRRGFPSIFDSVATRVDLIQRPPGCLRWQCESVSIFCSRCCSGLRHNRRKKLRCRFRLRRKASLRQGRHLACRHHRRLLGRQAGFRPKSDKLAPKVMKMVEAGQSYRQIAGELKIDKSTVMAIVRRARN